MLVNPPNEPRRRFWKEASWLGLETWKVKDSVDIRDLSGWENERMIGIRISRSHTKSANTMAASWFSSISNLPLPVHYIGEGVFDLRNNGIAWARPPFIVGRDNEQVPSMPPKISGQSTTTACVIRGSQPHLAVLQTRPWAINWGPLPQHAMDQSAQLFFQPRATSKSRGKLCVN
jgi:hypothetical protein